MTVRGSRIQPVKNGPDFRAEPVESPRLRRRLRRDKPIAVRTFLSGTWDCDNRACVIVFLSMNISPATEYAEEIRKRLGGHVRQVILFGSRARGDAVDGSDYDLSLIHI